VNAFVSGVVDKILSRGDSDKRYALFVIHKSHQLAIEKDLHPADSEVLSEFPQGGHGFCDGKQVRLSDAIIGEAGPCDPNRDLFIDTAVYTRNRWDAWGAVGMQHPWGRGGNQKGTR